MRTKNVYENMRVEMARRDVSIQDVAETLGVDRSTAGAKLSGKRQFWLQEALDLSQKLFDGLSVEYLFSIKKG